MDLLFCVSLVHGSGSGSGLVSGLVSGVSVQFFH
jgi:hypothetical protein